MDYANASLSEIKDGMSSYETVSDDEARRMRRLLVEWCETHPDADEVPQDEWLRMIDAACAA